MINFITTKLSDTIAIEGQKVRICPSHLLFIDFIQGVITKDDERKANAAYKILKGNEQYNANLAINAILTFINKFNVAKSNKNGKVVFDFDIDSQIVYADFIRFYSIDLHKEMHWHKFKALFDNLPNESQTSKRMAIRSITSEKEAKEKGYNWKVVKEIQREIKIEQPNTIDENTQKQLDELFYNS